MSKSKIKNDIENNYQQEENITAQYIQSLVKYSKWINVQKSQLSNGQALLQQGIAELEAQIQSLRSSLSAK